MLKTTLTHVIDCHDLDRYMKEAYGIETNVLQMEFECNNGSYRTFTVDGDSELDSIEDPFLYETWIKTGQMQDIELPEDLAEPEYDWTTSSIAVKHILHRLYNDGHIVAGQYLVEFWW